MERLLSVVTPATGFALTTLGRAQEHLGSAAPDAGLTAHFVDQASAVVASHLGRPLARETLREVYRLEEPEPHLPLARVPLVSITSIVEDGVTLTTDDWEADSEAGLLYRLSTDCRISWQARRIVVTYVAGYILPGAGVANLPADIERACLVTIASMAAGTGRDPQLRSESADGIGSASWLDPRAEDGALPWSAAALLAPWRRFAIA